MISSVDAAVKAHYEALPYPARRPEDEDKRLIVGSPGNLWELNHSLFAGKRDFSKPFRVLVAGGGTGDSTIMLAQQLADVRCPAEIIYLDLSTASRAVAEARAKRRGLGNIRFLTGSLLDVAEMAPGPYDYIDCCGVLHHLADPVAGMRALRSVLAPDGGMGIMVYGRYGRDGVYEMQEILQTLGRDLGTPAEKIALTRKLLKQLPPTNHFARNPWVRDHLDGGDAGLYDLLLHSRDRAYTVPEIAALARDGGMSLTAFIEPALYNPASYLNDPAVVGRLEALGWLERCALAEQLAGNLKVHVFYCVPVEHAEDRVARPDDPTLVPVLHELDGAAVARDFRPGAPVGINANGIPLRFSLPRLAGAILARIDGVRTIDNIYHNMIMSTPKLERGVFQEEFERLFSILNGLNKLFLRKGFS